MSRHYALIDGALIYDVLCRSPIFMDTTIKWHMGLLPCEVRRLAGPILIDMDLLNNEDEATKLVVEQVLTCFPGRLHVSHLQSKLDLTALAYHLERFTRFYDDDFEVLGLRFADTRILTLLPTVFTRQQWCEITAPLAHWTCLDRKGEEVVLALPEERASVVPENKAFGLSAAQLDMCMDANEPDNLLYNLGYTPQIMEGHLYDYWHLAQQCVQTWQQSGTTNREILSNFAIKIFNSKGALLKEKDWVTILSKTTAEDLIDR